MRRALTAFIIAPIATFLPYFLGWLFGVSFAAAVVMFGVPIAYVAALLFGIPGYFFVRKRVQLHRWYLFALFGGISGTLVLCVPFMFLEAGQDMGSYLEMSGFGMVHGAAAGFVFWLITKPDTRSSKQGAE